MIKGGGCGFAPTVTAASDDMQNVSFVIESDCENIHKFADKLPVVDAYQEIGARFDGVVYRTIKENLIGCCSGCVVPCGVFKAMQVAAGLALPAAASIEVTKQEG